MIWQAVVNTNGTTQLAHAGMTFVRNAPGQYTLNWSGFSGIALPYVQGVGANGTMLGFNSRGDGTGWMTVQFPDDALFMVALIQNQ